MAESKRQKREAQDISCAAGSNFTYPTVDEHPVLVEEPVKEGDVPPPLVEKPLEDDAEGDSFEGDGGYISKMVSRWAGSDYELSDDEFAPWKRYREID